MDDPAPTVSSIQEALQAQARERAQFTIETGIALDADGRLIRRSRTMAHTPGPWEARGGGPSYIAGIDDSVPHHVAKVDHDEQGRRRTRFVATCEGANLDNEANARLIAAAPELLLACVKTLQENGHLADGDNCTLIHLKRAIAKAGGAS